MNVNNILLFSNFYIGNFSYLYKTFQNYILSGSKVMSIILSCFFCRKITFEYLLRSLKAILTTFLRE